MSKIADICEAVQNLRLANNYMTISTKLLKEVDSKKRCIIDKEISKYFK